MNYERKEKLIRDIASDTGRTEKEVWYALEQAKSGGKALEHSDFMKQVLESLPKQKFTHRFNKKLRHQNL